MALDLNEFLQAQMMKGTHIVPARLQTALALLEKLRSNPSLRLEEHLASRGSSGLESHETYGNRAHDRLGLVPINKNHGRRSSSLQDWGQELLENLRAAGFETLAPDAQASLLESAQKFFADQLRFILEQEPLEARVLSRSAETVVKDLLAQADAKGRMPDVAQYLVGAKLTLRFGREIPAHPVNKGDRRSFSDRDARKGDFEIGDSVIEVALGLPDEKHLAQIEAVLEESDAEVWLLTRGDRVPTWRNELERRVDRDMRRVVVSSVEAFIGQNVAEMAAFTTNEKSAQFARLIEIYNNNFVNVVGSPGIRVVLKLK
jgi:hypothetical protein